MIHNLQKNCSKIVKKIQYAVAAPHNSMQILIPCGELGINSNIY